MRQLTALLLAVALFGCSTTLRPDSSMPAADAGYPTAEFWAQGALFHGLGEVLIRRGAPLREIGLEVQGYHEGVIRVDSLDCGVSQSWSYAQNEKKSVDFPGTAETSCLVDITVSPSFGDDADGNRVYEMKGQLLVKVLDHGATWAGYSSKVRTGGDYRLWISADPPDLSSPVRLFFRGCDSSYDWSGQLVNGQTSLKATDLSGPVQQRRCSYEGAFQQGSYAHRVSWRIWGYHPDFSPLPLPSITSCQRGQLCVLADESVSLIALDSAYVFSNEGKFKFDAGKAHTLRAFTVKGRTAVCSYTPPSGGWSCKN